MLRVTLERHLLQRRLYGCDRPGTVLPGRAHTSPIPTMLAFYILSPTQAQVTAAATGIRLDNIPSIASVYANGAVPYVLFDARRYNLGTIKQNGVDFDGSYRYQSGFGAVVGRGSGQLHARARDSERHQAVPLSTTWITAPRSCAFLRPRWAGNSVASARGRPRITAGDTRSRSVAADQRGLVHADRLLLEL